ncbi:MAG: ATP-binding protein [Oscillospiraceae bacterium]
MEKRKRTRSILISTALVTVLSIYALWLMCLEYRGYRQEILNSQDAQLFSVAQVVDQGLELFLSRYCKSLSFVVNRPDFVAAEQEYLQSGDSGKLLLQMEENLLHQEKTTHCLLASDEKGVRLSTDPWDGSFLPKGETRDEIRLRLCRNSDGSFGMCFTSPGRDGRLEYTLVLDLAELYRQIAAPNSYDSLLLMDKQQQLLVRTTSCGKIRMAELENKETMDKQDAVFSEQILGAANKTPRAGETAIFIQLPTCGKNEGYRGRMAIFDPDDLDNGFFTVCVSMHYDQIAAGLRRNTWKISLFAAIVAAAILHLIGKIWRIEHRRRDAEKETAQLRRRNKALADINSQEQEMAHHQRLQTIGTLTAGVAHEFNNLLTPIMGYSMLALEQLPDQQSELYDELLEIYQAACKSKEIVSRISSLSSKHMEITFKLLSLDRVVESVVTVLLPNKPANVELVTELNCGERLLRGSETHLSQVILNLCINSLHAMQGMGGVLKLHTELIQNELGAWAQLVVSDTGVGISAKELPLVFEPFYTTRPAGAGSGLGLPIVRQILDEHGGRVSLESSPQKGTRVTVLLPLPPEGDEPPLDES